ncbi:MAG: hypothetical protein IPK64_17490 [bacterium]|nr:hypothetical protein [bacterium]
MIDARTIARAFDEVGSRVVFIQPRVFRWQTAPPPVRLDIDSDRKGEYYVIRADLSQDNDLVVLDRRPNRRHLVLMLTDRGLTGPAIPPARFLCGHDERHWFVASLPEEARVTTVTQAMEALKPELVRQAQERVGLRPDERNRRRNAGFVRQGEWFFVPDPGFDNARLPVHRREPLRRGRGKPHVVDELVRTGGEIVYFNSRFRDGLTERRLRELRARDPRAGQGPWQVGTRNPVVLVRGRVRHPDHRTVVLAGWHRVLPNTESAVVGQRALAFID